MKKNIILIIGYTLKDAKNYSKEIKKQLSNQEIILSSLNKVKLFNFDNKNQRVEIFLTHQAFIHGDEKTLSFIKDSWLNSRKRNIDKIISNRS